MFSVKRVGSARLPLPSGEFHAIAYAPQPGEGEHVALVYGQVADGFDVPIRVHSECFTGDILGSLRCDCGTQLTAALETIVAAGRGVVIYVRGHEGRGIGLANKFRAYELQDQGLDTLDANLRLGLPGDAREYDVAAEIIHDLGVQTVRLITNNPAKQKALQEHGVSIVGLWPAPGEVQRENIAYLRTKNNRMGHLLEAVKEKA